jgi:AcrR family transcriptional regulator
MTRKRRTRDETRELLLDAAVRVVLARSNGDHGASTNPLAGVRITDALEEVNRVLRELDPDATEMTTGAVYNIWPNQEDFQSALLDRTMAAAAIPQIARVQAELERGLAAGADWRELVARCFGVDFEVSFDEPTMFLMIGVSALAAPNKIASTNEEGNRNYVAETGRILRRIIRHGGRRMAPGRTIEDLVWAIEAIEVGYLIRRRTNPEVTARTARGHTVVQEAIIALVEQFTVDASTGTGS